MRKMIEILNTEQANQFIDSYYNRMSNEAVERFIQAISGVKLFVIDRPAPEKFKQVIKFLIDAGKDAEHPIFLTDVRPRE